MTTHLLKLSHSLATSPLNHKLNDRRRHHDHYPLLPRHRRHRQLLSPRLPRFTVSDTLEATPLPQNAPSSQPKPSRSPSPSSVLLHVTGMMCGGCVSRVKSILSSDERVDSVVVNLLTETAAVKLRSEAALGSGDSIGAAESLAKRLTEVGFPSRRRVSEVGVAENVRKWREMAEKKEELLVRSRNRVAFAWTLVALCCGSHASHIFHSLGIHVAHGKC